jgi:5-methylcytosine-specific restriction endonuclease McrA
MKRHAASKARNYSPFHFFPCLRCGELKVTAFVPLPKDRIEIGDMTCAKCCAPHYLLAWQEGCSWRAFYKRDTRRHPFEYYGEPPQFELLKNRNVSLRHRPNNDHPFPLHGQISIYKRRRLSINQLRIICRRRHGRCHLCGRKWRLNQHGTPGWHIDHDIPNSGGGRDTEELHNFFVACAKCNLQKGNGRPQRYVERALRRLLMP